MAPIVRTTGGAVSGRAEHDVYVFRGIPYAEAPVGERRFRPPEPRKPWDGVLNCAEFGPICPQAVMRGPFGEMLSPHGLQGEDCLSLNIWTPELGAANLPVLFWIHGGGFVSGSGRETPYNGATYARDGVVCVTINYRLGAFGFLAVGDEGAGNFGILDQIAALQWVRDNIARFGGNPDLITIGGQSAGGWSVGALLAAPASRGLFRRAILMSGAAHHAKPLSAAAEMARSNCSQLGLAPQDLASLQAVPTEDFLALRYLDREGASLPEVVRRPGIDPVWNFPAYLPVYGTDVLPERPIGPVAAGAAAGVDVLIGHCTDEGRLFAMEDPSAEALQAYGVEATLQRSFDVAFPGRGADALAAYRRHHPGANRFDLTAALLGDQQFRMPAIRLADAQVQHASNVFFYRFTWPSNAADGLLGATHAVDMGFMWDMLEAPLSLAVTGPNPPADLARTMHAAWVAFVRTGDPATEELPPWPRWNLDSRPTMDFGRHIGLNLDPEAALRSLWDGVSYLEAVERAPDATASSSAEKTPA